MSSTGHACNSVREPHMAGPRSESERLEHDSCCDCQHLQKYLLAIIEERHRLYTQRMEMNEKNVERAKIDNAGMNEFRQTLTDQAHEFVRRAEYNLSYKNLEDRIGVLVETMSTEHGRASGVSMTWGIIAVVVSLLLSAGTAVATILLIKH